MQHNLLGLYIYVPNVFLKILFAWSPDLHTTHHHGAELALAPLYDSDDRAQVIRYSLDTSCTEP